MLNRSFYYAAVFCVSMVWYILLSYLLAERYSSAWEAHALAIYLTGFLEIGIEKYFYVKTHREENVITKGNTCLFAVVLPTVIAVLSCETAFLTSASNRYITEFCIIVAGTAGYRFLYWFIGSKLKDKI